MRKPLYWLQRVLFFLKARILFFICVIIFYTLWQGIFQMGRPKLPNKMKTHFLSQTNGDIHVFSVISINSTDNSKFDLFAVNIWINDLSSKDIRCCYLLNGVKQVWMRPYAVNQRPEMFNLTAQVECPVPRLFSEDKFLEDLWGITVTTSSICPEEVRYFKPHFSFKPRGRFNFAVCSKIAYGDLNVKLTVEWMEYYKFMGVSTVLVYPHASLSQVAWKLLEYYKNMGFVQLIPFSSPFSEATLHRPGSKTVEAWNDEQVVVYDCQSRLRGYDYVGVIDLDEFIVPLVDRGFKTMMERMLDMLPNMAAVEMYSELFISDWGTTNPGAALLIVQYQNRTISKKPVDINQRKLIHIPVRIQRGSVVTHGCKAVNDSLAIFKDPTSLMSINHYRRCVIFRDDCYTRQRVTDTRIHRFAKKIQKSVEKTKSTLGLT